MPHCAQIDDRDEDLRQSVRCASGETGESAVLRTWWKKTPVRLLERSAGGFGVLVPTRSRPRTGQVMTLAMDVGSFEVRVAHVRETAGGVHVGLSILREVRSKTPPKSSLAKSESRISPDTLKAGRLAILCGLFIAVVFFGRLAPAGWWSGLLGGPSPSPYAAWSSERREQELARGLARLEGLNERKVIAALALSASQQTEVRAIVNETTASLAQLYAHKSDGPSGAWSDLGLQLVHQANERIDRQLTPEQRTRWQALVAGDSGSR